jgi:hypothetical protein
LQAGEPFNLRAAPVIAFDRPWALLPHEGGAAAVSPLWRGRAMAVTNRFTATILVSIMGFTEKFRAQHDDILGVAGEITAQLKAKGDPAALRKLLSNMAGKVNFHLAMEDEALYPRLMTGGSAAVKSKAGKFKEEMGGLGRVFTDYNNKWQTTAIRADFDGFANETRKVFGALAKRIERENNELYPLADNAG